MRYGMMVKDPQGCIAASWAKKQLRPEIVRAVGGDAVKIREGVPITNIAAHVGHRRKSLTLDTYAHVLIDEVVQSGTAS